MEILRKLIGSAIGWDAQLISGGVLHTPETVAKFLNLRFKSWTGSHANRYTTRYHDRSQATPVDEHRLPLSLLESFRKLGGRKDDRFAAFHPAVKRRHPSCKKSEGCARPAEDAGCVGRQARIRFLAVTSLRDH